MVGFIFGGNTGVKNPADLARQREIIAALMASQKAPRNVGEGLNALGDGIVAAVLGKRADKAEAAGRESAMPLSASLGAALQGRSAYPDAPGAEPTDYPSQRVAQAFGDNGAGGGDIETYIRQAAEQRGIDPETAIRVAMSEGGVKDPFRQSDFVKDGTREQSYGPFQLYMGGGMGNDAMEAGIDPRKDWQGGVNFALDQAAKGGWSPWYGAKRVGINGMEGIGKVAAALGGGGGQPTAGGNPAIMQALSGGSGQLDSPMAGGGYSDLDAKGDPSMDLLWKAAGNDWMPEGQRKIAEALMAKRLDPMADLERRKTEAEIKKLTEAASGDAFTLGEGQTRFDAQGKPIASGPEKKAEQPSAVREYEFAKSQGFPGTFQDWEASKKGGMSLQVDPATGAVTFQQGANIKPLTEGQSKDTVYTTKAEGALPLIDKFGDALTSLGESVGGNVPVLGNYMKSPEYQQAEQAGQEFLMAILRKETGAAITDSEMQLYGDLYLPRPGDAPEKLAQKKASRSRAIEAIKAGMPPQALLYVEKALAKERAAGPKQPVVIDGYTIEEIE